MVRLRLYRRTLFLVLALWSLTAAHWTAMGVGPQVGLAISSTNDGTGETLDVQSWTQVTVYITAENFTPSDVLLNGWHARLTGAIDVTTDIAVTAFRAVGAGSPVVVTQGNDYTVALSECVLLPSGSTLVLAEVDLFFTNAFSRGALRLDGKNITLPTIATCTSNQEQEAFSQTLTVRNTDNSPDLIGLTPGILGWDDPRFPPHQFDVIAGIGVVQEFVTPLPRDGTDLPYSEIQISVEEAWVGSPTPIQTFQSTAAVWLEGAEGRSMPAIQGDNVHYAVPGERVVFIGFKYPEEVQLHAGDVAMGPYRISTYKCLLEPASVRSQQLYDQTSVEIDWAGAVNVFKADGYFDTQYLQRVLAPQNETLADFEAEVLNYYGSTKIEQH